MTAFPTYSTGTVAVANGATSIVGTGTTWSGTNVKPGDDIVIAGNTVKVMDVTDATHLVILPWPYTTVSAGASYTVIKNSPLRFAGGDAMAQVSDLIAALNTTGYFVFVGPAETVPDPSYGEDGQYAMQTASGKLWVKSSGTWNLVGTFRGFGTPAPWSGATAYNAFDVATLNGSSYVCILAHTNHTPPNATYWAVLAGKGDTGITGPAAWTAPAAWATATVYTAGPPASVVVQGGETYVCLVSHTSGTFATDLAASKWIRVAQKGSGDVTASNNGTEFTAANFASNLNLVRYASGQGLSAANRANARSNISAALQGHLFGLTLSTGGSSSSFQVAAGEAADSTSVDMLTIGSSLQKNSGSWAVGVNGGALDTGSISNTWYHVFVIKRPDTGVVDVLMSLSATSPTLPTNYTLFRRIGAIKLESSNWRKFLQIGDEFLWDVPIADVSALAITTSVSNLTLSVPAGVAVAALISAAYTNTSAVQQICLLFSPLGSAQAAGTPPGNWSLTNPVAGVYCANPFSIRSNTSAQICAVSGVGSNNVLYVITRGWVDARGRLL